MSYEIDSNGTKRYIVNRLLHREDGPAVEFANGTKYWYLNGKLHREDGPAVELSNGDKEWYLNGKKHREGGPAIEYSDGGKVWYLNGQCHREDGSAIELADGTKEWYLNDEYIDCDSNEEFLRIVKLKNNKVIMSKDEKLTERTCKLIFEGKMIVLRQKPTSLCNKGPYLGQHTCVQSGYDFAHWTNFRSCAMDVANLKWAFAIAKLYGCKVYSVKSK